MVVFTGSNRGSGGATGNQVKVWEGSVWSRSGEAWRYWGAVPAGGLAAKRVREISPTLSGVGRTTSQSAMKHRRGEQNGYEGDRSRFLGLLKNGPHVRRGRGLQLQGGKEGDRGDFPDVLS